MIMLLKFLVLLLFQRILAEPPLPLNFLENVMTENPRDAMKILKDKFDSIDLEDSIVMYGHGGIAGFMRCKGYESSSEIETRKGFTQEIASCNDIDVKPTNDAPESLDWSEILTSVKEQGTCRADSYFAVAGNVEAQFAIKYNKSIDLSAQQLIDCDELSKGCQGAPILEYVYGKMVYDGGLVAETEYPYNSYSKTCNFDKSLISVKVTGCDRYEVDDEEDLKGVLYKVGPLAIAIDPTPLEKYVGDIITSCDFNINITTGVLLVGYGTDNGVNFWKIRTSWGPRYGEGGYVRIARGRACGGIGAHVFSAVIE